MSDIPQARAMLKAMRDELEEAALGRHVETVDKVLEMMVRKKYKKRTGRQSATMTPELAEEIRRYSAKHKNLSIQRVANHFNVNQGRVSEALGGKND